MAPKVFISTETAPCLPSASTRTASTVASSAAAEMRAVISASSAERSVTLASMAGLFSAGSGDYQHPFRGRHLGPPASSPASSFGASAAFDKLRQALTPQSRFPELVEGQRVARRPTPARTPAVQDGAVLMLRLCNLVRRLH